MKNIGSKRLVAVILAIGLLMSYVIYQAVAYSKSEIETQIAYNETVYDYISANSFIVRDEEFIKNTAEGTTISFAKNGERVASGDTVSMVFSNETSAEAYIRITELENEIERYERLEAQADSRVVSVNALNSKINNVYKAYLDSVDNFDYSTALTNADEFRDAVTNMQIATSGSLDLTEKLNELRSELEKLRGTDISYSEIKSNNAGYYISGVDGYENALTYSEMASIEVADVEKALDYKPSDDQQNIAGRTVSSFIWYIACVVDSDEAVDITEDKVLYVNFPSRDIMMLPVRLYRLGDSQDGKSLVILSCDLMNEALCDIRIEEMQIVTQRYDGLKIKSSAIRTVDGQVGVYVLSGTVVEFKKVKIVYSSDNFTVVTPLEDEINTIQQYDKVIVKGVELYDSKLV